MKNYNFATAINQLGIEKAPINKIRESEIPEWARSTDFITLFLPHLVILGDSREQDRWIGDYCSKVGIKCLWTSAKGDIDNLKEGDYTFGIKFGNKTYNYTGKVAYERKGALSEFYGNCTGYDKLKGTSDRERIKRELERFSKKRYDKVVFLLQFGKCLTDLINAEFSFWKGGEKQIINVHNVIFNSLMSWRQPNNYDFDIIQSESKTELFFLMLLDMYYYFRNEIRNECKEKHLIGDEI